jgi:hypothetical protein
MNLHDGFLLNVRWLLCNRLVTASTQRFRIHDTESPPGDSWSALALGLCVAADRKLITVQANLHRLDADYYIRSSENSIYFDRTGRLPKPRLNLLYLAK